MQFFKKPLIITGIAIGLALVIGLITVTIIHQSDASSRRKKERAEMLGTGVGLITILVITPFWLVAATKYRKDRVRRMEEEG